MEDMRLVITRQAHLAGLDDEYVPITISRCESGLDPALQKDGGYGLFQLHRGGLAQATLTDEELLDPHVNASLAIRGMLGNYRGGKAKGFTGLELVQYVAYYSGWPTFAGPDHVTEQFPEYGNRLAKAYLDERAAEEADAGHVVTNEAPPIPDPVPDPIPEPVKEPEGDAPQPDPQPAPPEEVKPPVVDNVVNSVDKPSVDWAAISLHTGIPEGILEGFGRVPNVYRVKANETFADICGRFGVDAEEVERVNRIYPDKLYTGQVLYLC